MKMRLSLSPPGFPGGTPGAFVRSIATCGSTPRKCADTRVDGANVSASFTYVGVGAPGQGTEFVNAAEAW